VDAVVALTAQVPAIEYVKEETMPSGHRITALSERAGSSVRAVFGGAGARYVLDELARGAVGTMPACEITEVHVAMLAAWAAGDHARARTLFERTLPLLSMQAVFRWRLTKAILLRRGLIGSDHVRAPGPALDRFDARELDILLDRISDLLPLDAVPGQVRRTPALARSPRLKPSSLPCRAARPTWGRWAPANGSTRAVTWCAVATARSTPPWTVRSWCA